MFCFASGQILREFGNVSIGFINSSSFIKNLIVFGGTQGSIVFVDLNKMLLSTKIKLDFYKELYSLEFCLSQSNDIESEPQFFLGVSGETKDLSVYKKKRFLYVVDLKQKFLILKSTFLFKKIKNYYN